MAKSIPYTTIESWLLSYKPWQSRVELMESQLSHIPGLTQHFELVMSYGKGGHSEFVFEEAIRRLQISDELPILKTKVHLMAIALTALNKEETVFVEAKYFDHMSNNMIIDLLHLSRRGFYQMRKDVLEKIYRLLGGSTSFLWIEIPDHN